MSHLRGLIVRPDGSKAIPWSGGALPATRRRWAPMPGTNCAGARLPASSPMSAERRPRVLVTRPADDAAPLAERLRGLGFEPVIEPLLAIAPTAAAIDLDGIQAVLLTSANGARALARATQRRDLRVFAVGDATARAAREAGFERIASAGGDVGDLARLAAARCTRAAGALLHVAGREVAGDLAGRLAEAGFEVRRAVLYRAEPAAALSPELCAQLAAGHIDAALFLSPRTAPALLPLSRRRRSAHRAGASSALCLSPAVADALPAASSGKACGSPRRRPRRRCLDALAGWADETGKDRGSA